MQFVETPVLQRPVIGQMTGFIETIDHRVGGGARLIVLLKSVDGVESRDIPLRTRISIRSGSGLAAGDFIEAKVRLLPLPQPVRPSGYDFARDAYFKGIGAVGSVLGKAEVKEPPDGMPLGLRLTAAIDRARNALTDRMYQSVGGEAGGVAAALVTGKRGYIPEEANTVLRAAGIYHIVSISGLHMVIAAGLVFGLVRGTLAAFPVLALRWPLKKIAAIVAMVAAFAYCLFSGAEVATQRSLIMTLAMLGAIVAERSALSMHNLAIAALVVLALSPESLIGPGFQMSFAAVAALITLASGLNVSWLNRPRGHWFVRAGFFCVRYALALITTTIVAGLATAPFSAFHFQTATPLGIIGNSLALPLVSLIVMPMGTLGVVAYPFALDAPVWQVMGWAISRVMEVSQWVASLEGAVVHMPAFGANGIILIAFALIVATTMVTPLRFFAVIPLLAGLAFASSPERFVSFIDREGRSAVVKGNDGEFFVVGQANSFLIEQWLRADGDGRDPNEVKANKFSRCDVSGCVGEGIVTVAVAKRPEAFREDCLRADVIVSRYRAPESCQARVIIDRDRLAHHGAAAIKLTANETLEVEYVRQGLSSWPWQLQAEAFR